MGPKEMIIEIDYINVTGEWRNSFFTSAEETHVTFSERQNMSSCEVRKSKETRVERF